MKLVDLICQEQDGLARDRILFLRHATHEVELLEDCGATLQEYTAIQPTSGRFDFRPPGEPAIDVVVAMVRDRVHAVYRITGVLAESRSDEIFSPEFKAFQSRRKDSKGQLRPVRERRKYSLVSVESGATGAEVTGWAGREIMPVQRSKDSFFDQILVFSEPLPRTAWGTNTSDWEWAEGTPALRSHLTRERAPGLAIAKKRDFIKQQGRLYCERCELDPVEQYGTDAAESCIEVHHATILVSAMRPGHVTKLSDLQCLCANCHRLTHREMREANAKAAVASGSISTDANFP